MLQFVSCKHCGETGTCINGTNKMSCARCRSKWMAEDANYHPKDDESGLVCSVCWGKGVTEPTSSKWQNRFTPLLAGSFVLLAFLLVFVAVLFKPEALGQVLVFAGTLIGSITGYYFAGERANRLPPQPAKPKDG
jgi:phage terminase large subunit-like protein